MTYIVIDNNDVTMTYIVQDLQLLISDMYECELENGSSFEQINEWFMNTHKVIEVQCNEDQIKSMN